MDAPTPRPAGLPTDAPWRPPARGPARRLVVLLHGVGADGHDLIGLAEPWGRAVPDAAFLAPHAPAAYDQAPHGRQWFSLADRDPRALAAGVRGALPALAALLARAAAAHGLAPGAVAVMGFSQGAMMALATATRARPGCGAVLAYAGALLVPAEPAPARPPVLLVHGQADGVVPVAASRLAETGLRAAGAAVEAHYPAGLDHGLDAAAAALGAAFLARWAGAAPG